MCVDGNMQATGHGGFCPVFCHIFFLIHLDDKQEMWTSYDQDTQATFGILDGQ